jgi:putative ABC transport system permease protein
LIKSFFDARILSLESRKSIRIKNRAEVRIPMVFLNAASFWHDLRYSVRQLRRSFIFTAIALVTLTLGIGANTAIFSVIHSVFLRPLPYPQSDRLMFALSGSPRDWVHNVTASNFLYWREHSQAFESMAAYEASSGANLAMEQQSHYVRVTSISQGLFRTLGVNLTLGRDFSEQETIPNGPHAAIISYELWNGMFQGHPELIGGIIHLNGQSYTLAGVAPRNFEFVAAADVYVPLQISIQPKDQEQNYAMVGRLKPEVTLPQAQDEAVRIFGSFKHEYPESVSQIWTGLRWIPYREQLTGNVKTPLLVLFGAVSLVMLIAIANMATLFLSKMVSRQTEMGVRIALGASSRRLLKQLLTESLLVSVTGGTLGLYVAYWGLHYLLALIPRTASIDLNASLLPLDTQVALNGTVLLYTSAVTLFAGIAIGIIAWLPLRGSAPGEWIKSKGASSAPVRHRARNVLVVSEIVLSMALLFGASLLLASFFALRSVKLGFDVQDSWVLEMSVSPEQYKTTADAWHLQQQVSDRVRNLPGVVSVGSTSNLPVERGLNFPYTIPGCGKIDNMQVRAISSEYFSAMGIPVVRGRTFQERDGKNSEALINEALVRRCWPKTDPVGQHLGKAEIIGIVGNTREQGLDSFDLPVLYLPQWQVPDFFTKMVHNWFLTAWIIKTKVPPDKKGVQDAVAAVDPSQPIASLRPMAEVIKDSKAMATNAFMRSLLLAFSVLALLLTAIGIFGVTSHAALQRSHEIGIRMALGAQRSQVLRFILWQGLRLATIGTAMGMALSLILGHYLRSLLFGVGPTNSLVLIAASIAIVGISLVAGYIPARKATDVDPVIALRYQ